MIKIDVTGAEALFAAFERAQRALGDLTPVMGEIGDYLHSQVQFGFMAGHAPDGTPWAPLKKRDGKPLVDTGELMRSFMSRAMKSEVTVGTNLHYAAIHQFGGKAGRGRKTVIPARPMLPDSVLPAEWADDMGRIVEGFIQRSIQGD